jgi:hypothetical protein
MHKVLLTGILVMQWATLGAHAATYILDNGSISTALNASDGTEPRDNWFGNVFTAQANANVITRVDFGVFTTTPNSAGSVVIYRVTDPGGNPALGATRLYTQSFTPLTGDGTNAFLQQIALTSPVTINTGDRFLVAVFIPNVIGLPPDDVYPYLLDTSGVATSTYWDRSTPNTFNLDDLSLAKPIDQVLAAGGWTPGPGHIFIRAVGVSENSPPVSNPSGPYVAECAGAQTTVQLDGSASSDPDPGDTLTYAWTSDCPGATFDNPNLATPVLTVNSSPGCSVNCQVTLTVTDKAGATDTKTANVTVQDTTPPTVICPAPLVLEFSDENGAVANFVVAASDVCSSLILTVSPASGSMFPIGTTTVAADATDFCGNTNSCSFTVTILGARGVKQNVLDELSAVHAAVRRDRNMLDVAIMDLTASLDPALWVDETHVNCNTGGMVFQREKQTVQKFEEVINAKKSTISKVVLRNFVDRIVRSDRLLAVVAINEAVAAGGDPRQIALAQKELARGDAYAAAGRMSDAIEGYRIAWLKAQQSLMTAHQILATE